MSITLDLNKFKASGIYTLEFDSSENITLTPQTVRLVVGFSKKGPFNAPVFCPDIKTARTVFGDIDSSLERKGSFFHRSLFTCLQTGPVFALNLLALNDDDVSSPDNSDKVDYIAFSVDTIEANGVQTSRLASSFYNKQKFWFPDPEYLLATTSTIDKPKLFDFVNLGKSPMSIIVRKSAVKGFDITAKEWYNSVKVPKPEFLDDNDFINDFFVDVVSVAGDWTDYANLSIDPVYSRYFNAKGFKKDMLDEFTSRPEISLIASITGCLIPDFVDATGSNQFIESLVNNSTGVTGIFCAVNKLALDDLANNASQIDLVGHHLLDPTPGPTNGMIDTTLHPSIDLISYKAPLVNDQAYLDVTPSYADYSSPYNVLTAYGISAGFPTGTAIYNDWKNGVITDGDYIIKDNIGTKQYLKFFPFTDGLGDPYVEVRAYDSADFSSQENIAAIDTTYNTSGSNITGSQWNIVSLYGTYNEFFTTIAADPQKPITNNEVIVSNADAKKINIGDLLVDASGARLTRVLKKAQYDLIGNVKVSCSVSVKMYSSNRVQKVQKLQDFVQELQYFYLKGFTLKDTHMPNGSDARQNEILDVMYNTNIATSLASKDIITFRYIVDTFWGGIEPNSKNRLATLAKNRQQCLALLNAPAFKQFSDSTDPKFTDEPTQSNPKPILDVRYIPDGGNQSLNPSFTYTLVDENLGSKYSGYFGPFIILRENNKNISVPPSALVSNLFVRKFLNGTPFAIVAGPKRGLISDPNLVGVEYDLTDSDREFLEPFGINPIIRRRGVGVMIFANQTGYQRVNSALNNLHVRDMLITIEADLESILSNYLFEFNDPSIRLEIKAKVDSYLEGVQSAGGLFSFTTIMDSSNNTPEIIDNNMGIIDVIVEPSRGIHKFINRITIAKTGAIASGGFSVA
jgi:hypothetical protein